MTCYELGCLGLCIIIVSVIVSGLIATSVFLNFPVM